MFSFTGASGTTGILFGQRIEQDDISDLAGDPVTLSGYFRNSTLTTVTWTAYYANSVNTFGSLASPTKTQIATGTWTVNNTLTRYETTFNLPAGAANGVEIVFSVGAQTSGVWRVSNVQLERGTYATAYTPMTAAANYAECVRRFRWARVTGAYYNGAAGLQQHLPVTFDVPMRAIPTTWGSNVAEPGVTPEVINLTSSGVTKITANGYNVYLIATNIGIAAQFGYRIGLQAEIP